MYKQEAINLVEQVLTEGRFRDKAINTAKNADYDLDSAIKMNDVKKVQRLIQLYNRALMFIKEVRSQKTVNKYWSLPNWLIFLFLPLGTGAIINSIINKNKTKFTKEELDEIESKLKMALDKATDFISGKNEVKQEAAMILIEALSNLLSE